MTSGRAGRRQFCLGCALIVALAVLFGPGPVRAASDTLAPPAAAVIPAPVPAPVPVIDDEGGGLTDNQLQGYGCLAGAAVAVGLVALAGPTEVVQVMGGADVFTNPSAAVIWVSMAAGAGALACAAFGQALPAAIHAWDYLSSFTFKLSASR